jgi:ATP-dependent helicase/nuclease subunit A
MDLLTPHQKEALDFKNHISLTANAGSGKTLVLSKRYLEIALSLERNESLKEIAAITFTDKAASELYKKITRQIEERLSETQNPHEIKKLELIRRQLVSANISTIHSFCTSILREYPVEAGLDANFVPIDTALSNELIELSVEELIKSALNDSEDENNIKYLIRIFSSKRILSNELSSLIKNRKNILTLAENLYTKSGQEIASGFNDLFQKYSELIFLDRKNKLINELQKINNSVLSNKKDNKIGNVISGLIESLKNQKDFKNFYNILSEINNSIIKKGDHKIRAQGYLKDRDGFEEEANFVENYFSDLHYIETPDNAHEIELEMAKLGKVLIHFFNEALELYTGKKNSNGYLDYEDILLHTQKILANENVRVELSNKYQYIMIDEYQDTNELQYQIFLPILDDLKKGNFFVVGDEKQSIYMFRDADIAVFDKTKKNIEQSAGKEHLLSLPDSFRMTPELCMFANSLFKNLFVEPDILYNEVEHTNLVCARNDDKSGKVELLISGSSAQNENETLEDAAEEENTSDNAEAEMTASRILKLIEKDFAGTEYSWKDVAILCRKRRAFSNLEKAFIKYKIPFVIVGGKGFYQRQSVYDIFNYFSFLLDSKNDTALVGILRSPFFTVSDSIIYEISLQRGESYWQKLLNFAKNDVKIKSISEIIKENLMLAAGVEVTVLLRKILNESDILAVLASKSNGVQELANIDKLVKLTINFVSQGFKTLYDYVNFLKDSIEQIEDEAQAAVTDESNSVKIMTLHQAKGLEFPAVFLFKSDEISQSNLVKSKSVTVNKEFGLLTKVPLNGNFSQSYLAAPIIGINNLIAAKKNLAEIKRLFYVGVTRAKDYLFISAGWKKDFNYSKDSFIGLLCDGLNINFENDEIELTSDLQFLINKEDKYKKVTKSVSLNIPVIKILEETTPADDEVTTNRTIKEIKVQKIKDMPEGEFISATKVAVYKQCPLKYQLTYELGFGKLMSKYKNWFYPKSGDKNIEKAFEFTNGEDKKLGLIEKNELEKEINNYSDLKGRIIHRILQHEIESDLPNFIMKEINNELKGLEYDEKAAEELKISIETDLDNFFTSETYSKLKKYKKYKNEYEIYVKENDYYLYGIIDKMILEDEKIIIVDYKTDNISEEEIEERADSYINQLKFYSYIVHKLFENILKFELHLIFIKHPNKPAVKGIGVSEIEIFKTEIEGMVKNIREKNFKKNLSHCRKCTYAINHENCIKN